MAKKLVLKRRILLFPKKYYSLNSVSHNQNTTYYHDEIKHRYPIEVLERSLNEFIDMCNDDGFILSDYWIVKIKVYMNIKNLNNG